MTREEALAQLRLGPGINEDVSEEYNEAVDMAIEVLEQQPNEDCISRKAVFEGLKSIAKAKAKSDAQKSLMGRVMFFAEHLPSVAPQPKEESQQKTGHWIEHKHGGIEHIECSECGVWFLKANLIRKSYCPNCGSCNGDMIKNIMKDIANNNGGAK